MKSIMVALDGSPASRTGLQEAARWAALLGASLRGVFVEDEQRFVHYPAGFTAEGGVPISAPLPDSELAAENEKVRVEGEALHANFDAALKTHGIQGQFLQERGEVNAILTREARAAELVVIGCRGRNDPAETSDPGPTTETLIHNSLRPVLVVPEHSKGNGSVVFAHDGSRGAQRVLAPGTQLAFSNSAKVSVIAIGGDAELNAVLEESLKRYWEPYGIEPDVRFTPRKGKISAMIVDHARRQEAGMIVMGAFGHNPLHELFFGSTTLETLAQASCPVLLMA